MRRALVGLAVMLFGIVSGLFFTAPARAEGAEEARVALIGVPGLMWRDVSAADTPNLWRLAGQSAVGSLSVRAVGTTTCPYDGWLTVSAGVRSAVGSRCGLSPEPETTGARPALREFGWFASVAGVPTAGTVGQITRSGGCTFAVGAGAALALSDETGAVSFYEPSVDRVSDWNRCDVLAVDVDTLVRPYLDGEKLTRTAEKLSADDRRAAVRAADAQVGAVLNGLRPETTVLLAGLSDHGLVPHLRVAMMRTPETSGLAPGSVAGTRLLGAASTHRDDMVILPDLTTSLFLAAGRPASDVPATAIGQGWNPGEPIALADAAERLRTADVAGQTIRDMGGVFFTCLAVLQVLFYASAFFLLRRRKGLAGVRVAAVALASIPAATYLANLTPWAYAGAPTVTLAAAIVLIALALASLALGAPRLRSRSPENILLPLGVVSGVTAAVLLGDLLTGTTLQLNSVMGYTGVVGARYYGLGNIPFALLATAVLLVATAAADSLVRRGRRRTAVALVASLGVFAMVLDGWPGVGSDFGGVIAFVPGIAVATLIVAGRRVSILKLAAFCVAGGVVVMAIAYLDYRRPPASQTHLGRFVGQVIDGTFLPVITRKLEAMLHTLLSPNLMPVVLAAFGFLVFALFRPGAATAGVLPVAFERAPMLKAGLLGALVSGVVGMLVNDSGAAVLSMALALAVPLVLSAGIRALQLDPGQPLGPDSSHDSDQDPGHESVDDEGGPADQDPAAAARRAR
ncbi:hypothetical protein Aph01nite_12220 [Acrocarpospora phusangensis]|uniref:Uncharacterized protein n=1 Tax=Acrocarpospora phusangensis TaxID=1070424 RepID=A0A919Q5Y4_9ACTN|nr:hypothetical protein [Acrocarpospora phusangensis]GIH22912.1 hypothetical protein Aph01nite_12220 [Acrocarpospora phusangensis]